MTKRCLSEDHLVKDAADGPEVNRCVVAGVRVKLWGHVDLGAAARVGLGTFLVLSFPFLS